MLSDNIAISVRNLTKTYRLFGHPGDRIKQFFSLGLKQYHREFTALEDISFHIRKGETVGIIGRNGSGKSTLLQLICGILKPTTGTLQVNGRVSALLELGAGFNPEFTGRENVYFQGAVMGLGKADMDARFDDITTFAEIGEFIDQPVRTYSSGMFVRLAFAVAVHVDPEILVIDEALAVGDHEFQIKCLKRIDTITRQGSTVVIVSHALEQVAHHCDVAILLDHGRLVCNGDTPVVLTAYLSETGLPTPVTLPVVATHGVDGVDDLLAGHPLYSGRETRWGDGKASIQNVRIIQVGAEVTHHLVQAYQALFEVDVFFHKAVSAPIFGLTIKSMHRALIYSTNSRQLGHTANLVPAGTQVRAIFKLTPCLEYGSYLLSLGVASGSTQGIQAHDRRYDVLNLRIEVPRDASGALDMQSTFSLERAT